MCSNANLTLLFQEVISDDETASGDKEEIKLYRLTSDLINGTTFILETSATGPAGGKTRTHQEIINVNGKNSTAQAVRHAVDLADSRKKPIAGRDYDPNGSMSQDEYEYLTKSGQYAKVQQ